MRRFLLTACGVALASVATAQVPVIDNANLKIAQDTAKTTDDILDTNKEVLKTVQETLQAVTGDRGGDANQMQNLAVGNGFSVSQMPSLDSLMSSGVPNFGSMSGSVDQVATTFLNGLQLVKNALMHEGSMIITDLKGEIFRATAGYRRRNGSQVFLFAPGSERTNRYNPLDFVRADRGDRTTDIQNIAAILIPENTDSENSIWQATAQQVVAGVISYVLEARSTGTDARSARSIPSSTAASICRP